MGIKANSSKYIPVIQRRAQYQELAFLFGSIKANLMQLASFARKLYAIFL